MSLHVRIGTRASELALTQANMVKRALEARGATAELVTFVTTGDRIVDRPLHAIGGKGLFTAELEASLRAGEIECAVHSLKDLPTDDPEGLTIAAVLEREDPRDVLVARAGGIDSLGSLPRGARVGTSSLRRRAQLAALRSDLDIVELRGNVPTRVRKVHDGEVDAAILAGAGLRRLGMESHISAWLEAPEWLPAAGQGAIAVQARAEESPVFELLDALNHRDTLTAVTAERRLLAALGGGCQVPIGALAVLDGDDWRLHGLVADPAGSRAARSSISLGGVSETSIAALVLTLKQQGAAEILATAASQPAPYPQPE